MSTQPASDVSQANSSEQKDKKSDSARPIRRAAFWIIIVALLILWLIGWRLHYCVPWIHLLPAVALAALLVELLTGNSKNIDSEEEHIPKWDPAQPEVSLTKIHEYVLDEAAKSTNWYWKSKGSKALGSQVIRFSVWALAAVGGLLPIIGTLAKDTFPNLANGLWASLFLGVAAALLGLDKGFGFSSGWARYVLTATNIRKSLEEFRLDWTALRAKAGTSLTADTVAPLIERAKQFRSDIESLVLQETKDWVTEFQSTMAQMEKDVAAQLSTLKAQVDKTIQAKEAAGQPGYVQLTLKDPNNKLSSANLKVTLTDSSNKDVLQQQPLTSLTWSSPFIAPGLYRVRVEGTVNSVPFSQQSVATVKSSEGAAPAPDITL
ncbi:MAG: SLATT domain-containing protein [Candidatus Angelobacter sp.]